VWICDKYREAAALLLTFPAEGKSKCPLPRQERTIINKDCGMCFYPDTID
jgi:hypothetical protein